jgi:hypothetical protein
MVDGVGRLPASINYVILSPDQKGGARVAVDPTSVEENVEEPVEAETRRAVGNPIDHVAPTCMIWAMVAGLAILIGLILIWDLSHIGVISG